MSDEFPTLEVVAALGVLALFLRALIVASEIRSVPRFATELVKAFSSGDRLAALASCHAPGAPALARSARELVQAAGDGSASEESRLELKREQAEIEEDLARRAESSRARDLIVLAVLLSAMAFAVLSKLPVSGWFHALAALASLLLVLGFVIRVALRRVERVELHRIGKALSDMLSAPEVRAGRRRLSSIEGACRACGETVFLLARDAALGASLPLLGIHELRICKHCGFVGGQADDPVVLGRAALEELSVPLTLDDDVSADDTEHDG